MIKEFEKLISNAKVVMEDLDNTVAKTNEEILRDIKKAKETMKELVVVREFCLRLIKKIDESTVEENKSSNSDYQDSKEQLLQEHKDELLKTSNYYETLKRIK